MRRDYVQPFFSSVVKPVFLYTHKGYIDFDVDKHSFIKKYKNSVHLLYLLIKSRPDLVFSQEPFALRMLFINIATMLYSIVFKKNYVILAIENVDPQVKYGNLAICLRPYLHSYIKRSFRIIPINKDSEKLIAKYGSKEAPLKFERFLFGVWGVDTNEFSPARQSGDPQLQGRTVLFVGRLIDGKGIRYLIEAMRLVRQEVQDATLYIIGEGPLKQYIEDQNDDWIHFLGSVKNEDLPGYLRAAKVTCVPSITTRKWAEQLGMVNVQSIACATPIVSTVSGSIPEFFPNGEVGLLVPEKDPLSLAAALVSLLSDEDRRNKLGISGRQLAVEKYDANKNALVFEEFVSKLSNNEKP